ncbi:Glutamyl-tRNA reductase [Planctomycetes bacterium Pla163]|uniref:Glutamyl-tRNA reductase n=1 Tax=Rohdeia mirabilis TaxID=2528008 RepID=A0A518D4Y0_9BACT|nr:Glutamyl-tRNA reductase [Planctomycetes bacterium Pla163]
MTASHPDLERQFALIGLSHWSAPVDMREKHAVPGDQLVARTRELGAVDGVDEALLLSTCNRTEVLLVGRDLSGALTALRSGIFAHAGPQHLYEYRDLHAVVHLMRVGCGLDSLVLGESQILGQLRESASASETAGTLGDHLRPLLDQTFALGKRVRARTSLGEGTLSVARVAVDIAERASGPLEESRALIVGTGETGILTARHLVARGSRDLVFANRTLANAEKVTRDLGGRAVGLDALEREIARCDLVAVCVDGGRVLHRDHFERARLDRRDAPLVALDLSVPRAIDPEAAEVDGLLVYDLDDLARVVAENRRGREAATRETSEMLLAEVAKYLARRRVARAAPLLSGLGERFEEVRSAYLSEAGVAEDPRARELAVELSRRLLDAAFGAVKNGLRGGSGDELLDRAYRSYLDQR